MAGTISTVDTTSISDREVVDKMREDEDKDIEKRKEMVNLKERESEEAEKRVEIAKAETEEKQKEVGKKETEAKEKKKEAVEKETEAKEKKKEAEKAKEKAAKSDSEKDKQEAEKKQAEAEKAEKLADEAKEDAQKAAEEAKEAKENADAKEAEAKEEQEFAETKEEEAQSDRKDIASDTQKIIEEKKAEKKAEADAIIDSAIPGFGLKVVDEAGLLSELVLLDLKTENELKTSGINSIRGRNLFVAGKNLLAIAGTNSGEGLIALVLINSRNLEIIKQSEEDIAAESVLIQRGNDYYAVIKQENSYYIGRYNENIELQAKSAIKVNPYTPITVSDKGLLIQDAGNAIRLLKFSDLTNIILNEEENQTAEPSK